MAGQSRRICFKCDSPAADARHPGRAALPAVGLPQRLCRPVLPELRGDRQCRQGGPGHGGAGDCCAGGGAGADLGEPPGAAARGHARAGRSHGGAGASADLERLQRAPPHPRGWTRCAGWSAATRRSSSTYAGMDL